MTLEYKKCKIYYTDVGLGPAIVLLHGFLETSAMWKDFIPELSKKNRVICIDLLGHGQTDCLGYVHTMDDMADAVLSVLNYLQIESAKFIGHSMGGYVGLALIEKAPELIESLCLMNSTFEDDSKERKEIRTRAIKMAHHNYESLVKMSFSNLFAPESKESFKEDYSSSLEIALQTSLQGYIAAQEGMKLRPHRLDKFRTLNGKKLIITGQKDTLINSNNIKNQIKNTAIIHEELSEGHMSHIENKYELSYLFLHFIEY